MPVRRRIISAPRIQRFRTSSMVLGPTPPGFTPPPTGRQWLLGWYTFGTAQNPTPTTFLGFAPDGGDYDSSGEDTSPSRTGGFACIYAQAAALNPTALFVAIDNAAGIESGTQDYASAAAGNFDTAWDTVIANAKSGLASNGAGNYVLFVRIDPEFNLEGNLQLGGGSVSPATFTSAWNRCAAKWRAAGFKTCWNPSTTQAGDARGAVAAYFPGPQNCDLVGLDTYTNVGINQTAASIIGTPTGVGTLEWYRAQNFGNLPICFPEWGDQYNSTDIGTGDGSQMTAIINWMNGLGSKFVYAGWWNGEGAGHKIGSVGISVMQSLINPVYGGTYWPLPLIPTKNFPNYKP